MSNESGVLDIAVCLGSQGFFASIIASDRGT